MIAFPLGGHRPLQSGFIAFTFHPEFEQNGLLYTLHQKNGVENPGVPHFIPPGFSRTIVPATGC